MIWTPERVEELRDYRNAHRSISWCAREMGTSTPSISYACRTFGIIEPPMQVKAKSTKPEHFCKGCWAGTIVDEGKYVCMFPKHCERRDGKL